MRATAKHFTPFGNLALVQLQVEPLSDVHFRPGGPELKEGGLVISEATGQGVVGMLLAVNNTKYHLLLTDADVLIGAKQNRVLNKSVLLAPGTKTSIDVSCIERLRWQYTTPHFSNPASVADLRLRKSKVSPLPSAKEEPQIPDYHTQQQVWRCVSHSLLDAGLVSLTESYEELAYRQAEKLTDVPQCEALADCNALALLVDGQVASVDIFGNEACFRHYFPLLRDAAFRSHAATSKDPVGQPEAYYKSSEAVDSFLDSRRVKEKTYAASGIMELSEAELLGGFILSVQGQLIHAAGFAKQ